MDVAGTDVGIPRDDGGGIHPAGAFGFGGRVGIGDRVGDDAVGELVIAHGGEPAFPEGVGIGVEQGGGAEDFGIAGPTEAFVALGAVGGDVDGVAAPAPGDVGLEFVEHVAGGGEGSDGGEVGVEDDAGDPVFLRCGIGWEAGELDIAEAVEGEVGLPLDGAGLCGGVGVGGFGGAIVFVVERAIGVEHFGEAEGDGFVFFDGKVNTGPADHVLAEIEDVAARLRLGNVLDMECVCFADGSEGLGGEQCGAEVGFDGDGGPGGALTPGVELFAVVDAGSDDGAVVGGLPLVVGGNDVSGVVVVGEFELEEEGGVLAVIAVGGGVEGEAAGVPAVGEKSGEVVVAGVELGGDIVGERVDAFFVIGIAVGEVVVGDALAVEGEFEEAAGGDVKAGAGDFFGERKGTA